MTPGDLVIVALVCGGIGCLCLLAAGITALVAAYRYARRLENASSQDRD